MRNTHAHFIIVPKHGTWLWQGSNISIHLLKYRIKFSSFTFLAQMDIFYFCLLTCQCLILYVCSAQSDTRGMTSEEERLARLRRTLHSLAKRIPKIILIRVDCSYRVLKDQVVSVMYSIICICMYINCICIINFLFVIIIYI
jgi:hypothetical protein